MFGFLKLPEINKGVQEYQADEGAVLLDVRDTHEYESGHIPGAINIPRDEIERVKELIPEGESLCMVIALGYGETAGVAHKGKEYADVAIGEDAPDWFTAGVEAALLAPTAMNQQKFKLERHGRRVAAKAGLGFFTKVDLGIVEPFDINIIIAHFKFAFYFVFNPALVIFIVLALVIGNLVLSHRK